jgi:hypothetical protein
MMATNLKGFIKNVEDNGESYEAANQAMDSLFCLKLLHKINLIQNCLFHACLINDGFMEVDWNMCDFCRIHSLVMDENFQQLLPANLGISNSSATANKQGKSTKNEDKEEPPTSKKKKAKSPIREGDEKGNQLINPDPRKSLKLKPGEDHHAALVLQKQQLKNAPKWTNSQLTICGNWHISGCCHSRCKCLESHKKLTLAMVKEGKVWLWKCCDNNK